MEVIYPEETLALLAKYDKLIHAIEQDYQRLYPEPPDSQREILGERAYAEKYHDALHKRRYFTLEDPIYKACIQAKTKIISMSIYTYLFDADEVSHWQKEE